MKFFKNRPGYEKEFIKDMVKGFIIFIFASLLVAVLLINKLL